MTVVGRTVEFFGGRVGDRPKFQDVFIDLQVKKGVSNKAHEAFKKNTAIMSFLRPDVWRRWTRECAEVSSLSMLRTRMGMLEGRC